MCSAKTAGIILIGDEVLKGQVEDKNLPFLAKKLVNLGIRLCKVSIVPDVVDDIAKEIAEFSSKYDKVITTGGIGPTHDDVTYQGVAVAFNDKLVLNKDMADFWTWFNNDIDGESRKSSLKMAMVPSTSVVLYPNIQEHVLPKKFPIVTVNNVCIFPGIPYYVKAIFEGLQGSYFVNSGQKFIIRRLYLNVWESVVTDYLNEAVERYNTISFGSYPKVNCPYYKVVIYLEGDNPDILDEALQFLRSKIRDEYITDEGGALGDAWLNVEEAINNSEFNTFNNILQNSIELIEKIFEENSTQEVFLAFNGGKDCTAVMHLVHTVLNKKYGLEEYPKITALYVKSENPFEEVDTFIQQAARRYRLNLIVHSGRIKEVLAELTSSPVGNRWKVALMGTRRNDPCGQQLQNFQKTDKGWSELIRASPILEWTYSNVWTFLRTLKVPYCKLYDMGYTSIDEMSNTIKNPSLKYKDASGNDAYHPAYMLADEAAERDQSICKLKAADGLKSRL